MMREEVTDIPPARMEIEERRQLWQIANEKCVAPHVDHESEIERMWAAYVVRLLAQVARHETFTDQAVKSTAEKREELRRYLESHRGSLGFYTQTHTLALLDDFEVLLGPLEHCLAYLYRYKGPSDPWANVLFNELYDVLGVADMPAHEVLAILEAVVSEPPAPPPPAEPAKIEKGIGRPGQ